MYKVDGNTPPLPLLLSGSQVVLFVEVDRDDRVRINAKAVVWPLQPRLEQGREAGVYRLLTSLEGEGLLLSIISHIELEGFGG